MSLPKYINSRSLTDLLNSHIPAGQPKEWTYQRVQNILKRMGIARKQGQAVVVAPEDLAGAWPDMYEHVLAELTAVKPFQHGHVGIKRNRKFPNRKKKVRKDCTVQPDTADHIDTPQK